MFSDAMQKIDTMRYKTMLGVAACLVILCQLIAMVLVVDGQVKKAEVRDTSLGSQRTAIAQCNETSPAAARQKCIEQATAAPSGPRDPEKGPQVQALSDAVRFDGSGVSIGKVQGFMPASLSIR